MKINETLNFPFKNGFYKTTLIQGIYKFECWGSSGGDSYPYIGGRGGYVSGVIF